jgi:hypothetical protein
MEQIPNQEQQYRQWADQLDTLQKAHNDGRGIEPARWIVEDLREGNFSKAQANYRNQSDKFWQYANVLAFLEKIGVAQKTEVPPLED